MSTKWGVNPRAEEKREREKQKKDQQRNKKEKEAESKKWRDETTQKHVNKQKDKERDREDELRKKQEKRRLVEQEEKEMEKISKKGATTTTKLTMAEIAARQAKMYKAQHGLDSSNEEEEEIDQMPENTNHLEDNQVSARSVNEALEQLDLSRADKHPEKRMKAAWNMFVDQNMARVKAQNPNLKRSQHLMILQEEWKKSADNPFNQKTANYNSKV